MTDVTMQRRLDGHGVNDDWIRAARLKKLGTPEALAELERMENQVMVGYIPE